jgi:hypothetical protein
VIAAFVSNNNKSSDAAFDLDLQYLAPAANTEVPGQVIVTTAAPAAGDAGTKTIRVTWTKPACDGSSFITRYTITPINNEGVFPQVRGVPNPFVTKYATTFGAPGSKDTLTPCTDYLFEIRAFNAAGSSEPVQVVTSTTGCD